MKKIIVSLAVAAAIIVAPAATAVADVSHTQSLPTAACNQGTMNAHNHIPETTGTGATTPGHGAVPGTANTALSGCGHGG
jgi:hypothetical protein